jgi:dipeptidyl aminopeptidase/acylaminoacyl peptidase
MYYIYTPYQQSIPRHLLSSRPILASLPLLETEAISIPTRDGESCGAYLTRPAVQSGEKRHPLVLVIHGGPSARDYGGFNPITQLLSTRGMLVLTVNYRGSTGYGTRFSSLGSGNLRGMHNDVDDARRWAINNGLADPKRIAVLGASFGGYLSLGLATGIAEKVAFPSMLLLRRLLWH